MQLFGYYLISFGPGALPLAMSVMNTNYRGMTKKMTMTALMFVAYCTGNMCVLAIAMPSSSYLRLTSHCQQCWPPLLQSI